YERIRIGGLPGCPSPGTKPRPSAGDAPSSGNSVGVTPAIAIRGAPDPAMATRSIDHAPRPSSVFGDSCHARYVRFVMTGRNRFVLPWRDSYSLTSRGASAHGSGLSSTP